MRLLHLANPRSRFGWLAILGLASLALVDASCSRKKDGILVEVTDELDKTGAVVRDWRRSGVNAVDVQIFTETAIPTPTWTLAAYDKQDKLLTSGRIPGPRTRARETVWIHLALPTIDMLDRADRIVIGIDLSPRPDSEQR